MNKKFTCFLFMVLPVTVIYAQSVKNTGAGYQPTYWLEGAFDSHQNNYTEAALSERIDDLYAKGWRGLTYWGADRNGAVMNYFYTSPYLAQQQWAVFKNDGLSPIVKAAHQKGMKVMVNMEGVNPYHWKQNQWTPERIKAVAGDLSAAGIDAVFEECFEVKPSVFVALAQTLKSKGVNYISGTDPMLLREANFATLWPQTGTVNIYNYYLKRDKIYNIATLAQY